MPAIRNGMESREFDQKLQEVIWRSSYADLNLTRRIRGSSVSVNRRHIGDDLLIAATRMPAHRRVGAWPSVSALKLSLRTGRADRPETGSCGEP